MWFFKLSLTTLWMAANVIGWTLGGAIHVVALAVVALVVLEGTSIERRLLAIPMAIAQRLH